MQLTFTLELGPEERDDLRNAISSHLDLISAAGYEVDDRGNFVDVELDKEFNRLDQIRAVL